MIVCNFFLFESLSPSVYAWEVGELLGADLQVCLVLVLVPLCAYNFVPNFDCAKTRVQQALYICVCV